MTVWSGPTTTPLGSPARGPPAARGGLLCGGRDRSNRRSGASAGEAAARGPCRAPMGAPHRSQAPGCAFVDGRNWVIKGRPGGGPVWTLRSPACGPWRGSVPQRHVQGHFLPSSGRVLGPAGPRRRRPAQERFEYVCDLQMWPPWRFCELSRVAGRRSVCLPLPLPLCPGSLLNPSGGQRRRWSAPTHVHAPPKCTVTCTGVVATRGEQPWSRWVRYRATHRSCLAPSVGS